MQGFVGNGTMVLKNFKMLIIHKLNKVLAQIARICLVFLVILPQTLQQIFCLQKVLSSSQVFQTEASQRV